MNITAGKIYRDTKNFFRYHLLNVLLISILCSFITILINYFFTPNLNQLFILIQNDSMNYNSIFDRIHKMNTEQHKILLSIAFAGTFSSLVGNVFLINSILTLIIIVIYKELKNFLDIVKFFFKIIPKLLMLICFITLAVQLGFMILLFPGIIIIMLLSLSSIILVIRKTSIFDSIHKSVILAFNNIKLIAPAIIAWLLVKMLLIILMSFLYSILSDNLLSVTFNMISYLVLSMLIIYLTRLYLLLNN